jgi:hypothetical protein
VRAHRHAALLVAAAKLNSLDLMPPSDARALVLLDSLSWSIGDDDVLLQGNSSQLRALRARFGDAEVEVRMKFLSLDAMHESPRGFDQDAVDADEEYSDT